MTTAATRFDNGLRYRDATHPHQTALTPGYVLEPVRAVFGGQIGCDPCTEPDNPTDARLFYALPDHDGLDLPWDRDIFVNPPYGKAREPWVRQCMDYAAGGFRVVLLIPAATDTRIWQHAVASASSVVFVRGRLKFGVLRPNRRQVAASHPSSLIGWNVDLAACAHLGLVASSFSVFGGAA